MTPIRLLVARLRQDRLPVVLLVLVVALTAFLAASAPRLLLRTADAGLRHEVATASVVERNLLLGRITDIPAGAAEGMGPVLGVAREVEDALPASLRSVISGGSVAAETVNWGVLDRPPERPGFVILHAQGDLEDRVTLIEGRMPTGITSQVDAPPPPVSSVPLPPGEWTATLFEVALSTRTAAELDVEVGDRMDLVPDPDDPLVGAFAIPSAAAVEVVGLFEVVDPDDDFWGGDYSLDQPTLVPVGLNVVMVYATALLSPDAYPAMTPLGWPMRFAFRHTVDPDRFDVGLLDQLATDLRRMDSQYAAFATTDDPERTTLQTALPSLLDRFAAEHRTTQAVLVTSAIGPASVALLAIGVLALLGLRRRRRALVLIRGRGGSAPQLTMSHIVEGLLLTAGPAALGAWLAVQVVASRPTSLAFMAAGIVALAATVVIAGMTLPAALASLHALDRDDPSPIGASPRRLAFEGLAVVLAIGGVVLLRQRGLAGGSAAGALGGVDPFLAAVPALVGIAVGIVTVRLYPYPVRLAGIVAGGARGLVPALGLRRAERQAGTGHLPLIVLLLTVAIGTFSSTMLATIDRGQVDASWQAVGAAYRVGAASGVPDEVDLAALPGVEATAGAHEADATIGIAGGGRSALVAIDAAAYRDVTAGTPIAVDFPAEFYAEVGDARPGTTTNPIPAIVSSALRNTSTTSLNEGDVFELTYQARFATFVVADVRAELPTLPAGRTFIVVPRAHLAAGLIDRPLTTTSLFIRGDADATTEAALREALAGAGAGVRLQSRAGQLAAFRDRPLVEAVERGFGLALAAAIGYAALAILVSLTLAGSARARETAHLRTLGLDRRQVVALAILEHGPPVLVAVVAGLVLGVGVGWLVLPGLGLAAFTAAPRDPALTVSVGQLAVIVAALVAVVLMGVMIAAAVQRRTDPARAVREGIE
ncbi:MAG TPA: FtsX-like permease family protein [Candidatus Limnocylindria bacterium]